MYWIDFFSRIFFNSIKISLMQNFAVSPIKERKLFWSSVTWGKIVHIEKNTWLWQWLDYWVYLTLKKIKKNQSLFRLSRRDFLKFNYIDSLWYTSVIPVHTHFVIHQITDTHWHIAAVKNFPAINMFKYIDFLKSRSEWSIFEKFNVLYVFKK